MAWKRCPAAAAAVAAYVIASSPTLGLAQSGWQLVADRYSYVPLVGMSLLVGGVAAVAANGWRVVLVSAPVLVLLAGATWRQTFVWHDGATLWAHALAVEPGNALVHQNLADVAFDAGDLRAAERHFRDALARRPDLAVAHLDLGRALAEQGRNAEAVDEYRKALEFRPRLAGAYAALGVALGSLGQDEAAIAAFRQSLELEPRQVPVHAELGMLLEKQGRTEEALREYDASLALQPTTVVLNNKALLLQKQGRSAEAVGLIRGAIGLSPRSAPLYENLAYALLAVGDRAGAIAALEQVVRLEPTAEQPRRMLSDLRSQR